MYVAHVINMRGCMVFTTLLNNWKLSHNRHHHRENQDPSVTVQDLPDDEAKASMARLEPQSRHKRWTVWLYKPYYSWMERWLEDNTVTRWCIWGCDSITYVGLFSNIMRDMANMINENPKWIVLDGDIDPMWIESLNTVMDDNKVCSISGSR